MVRSRGTRTVPPSAGLGLTLLIILLLLPDIDAVFLGSSFAFLMPATKRRLSALFCPFLSALPLSLSLSLSIVLPSSLLLDSCYSFSIPSFSICSASLFSLSSTRLSFLSLHPRSCPIVFHSARPAPKAESQKGCSHQKKKNHSRETHFLTLTPHSHSSSASFHLYIASRLHLICSKL